MSVRFRPGGHEAKRSSLPAWEGVGEREFPVEEGLGKPWVSQAAAVDIIEMSGRHAAALNLNPSRRRRRRRMRPYQTSSGSHGDMRRTSDEVPIRRIGLRVARRTVP